MVPLKYLNNFWRTLKMSLINYEINPILTLSANCFITDDLVNSQISTFYINWHKTDVPVKTLPTWDNTQLLQQLKSGFERTIN